jgi:hypothetical protein
VCMVETTVNVSMCAGAAALFVLIPALVAYMERASWCADVEL